MAINASENAYKAPAGTAESAQRTEVRDVIGGTSIFEIAALNSGSSQLSAEGKKFVEQYRALFDTLGEMDPNKRVHVKHYPVTIHGRGETLLTVDEDTNTAILLIFAQTVKIYDRATNYELPPTHIVPDFVAEANKIIPGYADMTLLEAIVIADFEYDRAKNFTDFVARVFRAQNIADTISDLASREFLVTTDPKQLREFMLTYDPHKAEARMDYGVLIHYRNDTGYQSNQQSGRQWEPLIGVPGYSDASNVGQAGDNVKPITVLSKISHVISSVPNIRLVSLVLPTVGLHFAYTQHNMPGIWSNPFRGYVEHSGKKATDKFKPNLGMLVELEQGKWLPVPDQQTDTFIRQHVGDPIIALDVVDGRACIPGMQLFADPNSQEVISVLSKYIGSPIQYSGPVYDFSYTYFTGAYKWENNYVDSRTLDYFHVIGYLLRPISEAAKLTQIDVTNPYFVFEAFREWYPIQNLYITTTVTLLPGFMNALADAIATCPYPPQITSENVTQSRFNFGPLANRERNYMANRFQYASRHGNFQYNNRGYYGSGR